MVKKRKIRIGQRRAAPSKVKTIRTCIAPLDSHRKTKPRRNSLRACDLGVSPHGAVQCGFCLLARCDAVRCGLYRFVRNHAAPCDFEPLRNLYDTIIKTKTEIRLLCLCAVYASRRLVIPHPTRHRGVTSLEINQIPPRVGATPSAPLKKKMAIS